VIGLTGGVKLDKKGQIGKIVATFPVMILLVVIMGLFIFASSVLSIKGPVGATEASGAAGFLDVDNSVLFEMIEVRGRSISVLDGMILVRSSELERMDKTLAVRNGLLSGEGERLLQEEIEGELVDRVDGAAIRSTYTRDFRKAVSEKLERDSKEISEEICFILVDSDNPIGFIFNSGLQSTSVFFKAKEGSVEELKDSNAIAAVKDYQKKGFLTETKFEARLPYEVFYIKEPSTFSSQGRPVRLKFANKFALYSYSGPCKSEAELK